MLLSLPPVFQILSSSGKRFENPKRSAKAGRAVSINCTVSPKDPLFDSPARPSKQSDIHRSRSQLTSPSWLIYYAQQQRIDSASDARPISTAWHGQRKADVQCRRRGKRAPLLCRLFADQSSRLWPRRSTRSPPVPHRPEAANRHDTDEYAVFNGDVDVYRVRGPPVSLLQPASSHGTFCWLPWPPPAW